MWQDGLKKSFEAIPEEKRWLYSSAGNNMFLFEKLAGCCIWLIQ
jgi:hypothetical protein